MPVLKNVGIKKQMQEKFDKEEIDSKTSSRGFHYVFSLDKDGAWRWRSHLVNIWAKCKARHAKHRNDENVQGEVNLKLHKFPLIEYRGGNVHIPSKEVFCSAYSRKL